MTQGAQTEDPAQPAKLTAAFQKEHAGLKNAAAAWQVRSSKRLIHDGAEKCRSSQLPRETCTARVRCSSCIILRPALWPIIGLQAIHTGPARSWTQETRACDQDKSLGLAAALGSSCMVNVMHATDCLPVNNCFCVWTTYTHR